MQPTPRFPKIYRFFEEPNGPWSIAVTLFIIFLILLSVGLTLAELILHKYLQSYHAYFWWVEVFITACFTVEYVLRLISAPSIGRFITRPMNIIDLLAIIPFYLSLSPYGNDLRIIRLLRFFRLLRLFRIFRCKFWDL